MLNQVTINLNLTIFLFLKNGCCRLAELNDLSSSQIGQWWMTMKVLLLTKLWLGAHKLQIVSWRFVKKFLPNYILEMVYSWKFSWWKSRVQVCLVILENSYQMIMMELNGNRVTPHLSISFIFMQFLITILQAH